MAGWVGARVYLLRRDPYGGNFWVKWANVQWLLPLVLTGTVFPAGRGNTFSSKMAGPPASGQ